MVEKFPMFKLATLFARQMSSPIATQIKKLALSHPRVGEWTCVLCARAYSVAEWNVRALSLRMAGIKLTHAPPPMSTAKARDLGADLLGELILFAIGSLIIIFEVNRQADKQEAKKLYRKSEWVAIALSLEELQRELRLQQEDIDRLRSALDEMERKQNLLF